MEDSPRIPTLDGWRGVAILLVLFDHIQFVLLRRFARPWTQTGQHGVTIFFVLSGFLITSKLMEGPIDLRRFYLRRFFRLMPVAWIFLAFLLLFDRLTGTKGTSLSEVRSCLFSYRNFLLHGGNASHFWTLSLEEQFYLVWPVLLLLAGVRRCRWVAIFGAISCAFYRWIFWAHYSTSLAGRESQVRADALLVGCLLAFLMADPRLRSSAARWTKVWALPASAILLFCIARFHEIPPLTESLCIAELLAATVLHPQSLFAQPLSFPALGWLGTVSYSVYVWQEFFMGQFGSGLRAVLLLCFALPLFALGSYYCIERPCTRFAHRLTRQTSRTPEEAHQLLA
jgi:peptidoglycan/LPS O-acetylase OafA/YrhL